MQGTYCKDNPRSWKKNGGTNEKIQEMFNKDLEELKNKQKDEQYNN